jgi:hypothetical protein
MNELEVGVGQWSEPGRSGSSTTASAYAGFGEYHLVVVADSAKGATPTKSIAQAAVAAVTSAFRSGSAQTAVAERLADAFRSVHAAIQEATIGTQAEGRGGAEIAAFIIEPGHVTFARVGGGRLYVLESHGAVSFPVSHTSGFAGDGTTEPDIVTRAVALMPGDRLVLTTEATARTIAADIGALAQSSSPQLTAQALVGAARRRGERGALVAHVVEIRSEAPSRTRRPTLATADIPVPPAIGLDGRQMRGMPSSKTQSNLPWGWLIALASLAAVTAYWPAEFWLAPVVSDPGQLEAPRAEQRPTPDAADTMSRDADLSASTDAVEAAVPTPEQVAATTPPTAAEERVLKADELDSIPVADTIPSDGTIDPNEPMDTKVADIFKWDNPRISARDLKRYLVRSKANGKLQRSLKMIERWIVDHPDRATFLVIMHFQEKRTSTRLKRWARQQMATLYDAR